jgi:hypothetical protein
MAKTLSESAAEILRASMNAAGKEPAAKLPGEMEDLGGQTPESQSTAIGAAAAAKVKEAPKPGKEGVPAEPAKKLPGTGGEEVVADSADDESGVKKMAKEETEESSEEVIAEEEATEEVVEISEEELLEAKKKMMKDMVAKHKGSMKEDVDALFNGESLSEDFRVKATLIFESAVQSRVEKIVEDILNDNDEVLADAYEQIKEDLNEQVDDYLNYVVEEWVNENKVAIETGLRAELVEDFIGGLKNLFAEHYIEIPDEKVDVAEELAVKVTELEEQMETRAAELATITEELNKAKKHEAIRKICEGLTEVQVEKMKSLAEGVEFTTEGEFDNKLATLRENYFPANKVTSEVKVAQETSVEQPEVEIPSYMENYVKAITKSLPK